MNPTAGGALRLPFDLSRGQPILAVAVNANEAVGVMRVQQLLNLVPDPIAAEDTKRTASDPILGEYAELRSEVQRAVQGAKAKNAPKYCEYIIEGLQRQRPFILPPITLYHPKKLEMVELGQGVVALMLPYGEFLVAIDGETQRIAWQKAAREYPDALGDAVKVVIHHGKTIQDARQGFYDLNTREVKPSAALSISMDTRDFATAVTRELIENCDVIKGRVHLQRRQLRRTDRELLTISALRTGIVTTILGTSGLQVGSRPIGELPEDTDLGVLQDSVIDVWSDILCLLEEELQPERRPNSVASASSILAGIGMVAHHVIPSSPRKPDTEKWSVEEVLERLLGITWERTLEVSSGKPYKSVWDGIAGKFTQSGRFAVGGPKEVAYAIAEAIENPDSEGGRQIRVHEPPGTSTDRNDQGSPASANQLLGDISKQTDLVQALTEILQKSETPLHIRELQQRLREKGCGEAATQEPTILIALRRNSDRFSRVGPGQFALVEWGHENVPPVRKKRKVYRSRKHNQ